MAQTDTQECPNCGRIKEKYVSMQKSNIGMEEIMDWKKISKEIEIKQRYKYIPIHIWRKP